MPDRLYLSLWLRGFDASTMLRHFQQLLEGFPYSRLRAGISAARIYALEEAEPPLFERAYTGDADPGEVIETLAEFENPDCAYQVDAWWELWSYDREWKLAPSRVTLFCFGPEFDNEAQDHLRLDLGLDSQFVPDPELPQAASLARSNLQSVLTLASNLAESMPVEKRRLWLETGENFAERVEDALADLEE